jgi:hypothetical protein
MDKAEKMDCRANGEIFLRVRERHQPDFCEMSYKEMAPHSVQDNSPEPSQARITIIDRSVFLKSNTENSRLISLVKKLGPLRKERICLMNRPLINYTP